MVVRGCLMRAPKALVTSALIFSARSAELTQTSNAFPFSSREPSTPPSGLQKLGYIGDKALLISMNSQAVVKIGAQPRR